LEAAMAGLVWRIPVGQIFPRRAGAQYPEDAVENGPRVGARPAFAVGSFWGNGIDVGFEHLPLFVGEIHAFSFGLVSLKNKGILVFEMGS
jgi:hypothetical protein